MTCPSDGQLFGAAAFEQLPGQLPLDTDPAPDVDAPARLTYRERRARKAERLLEWADGREAKADERYQAAHDAVAGIPFGQPILVGHHSERAHRNTIERSHRAMDKMIEHNAKASDMRSRAENIERQARTSIYSDDPDAIEQLTAKLAKLEAQRETMKARNAEYRKTHKAELRAETNSYLRGQMVPFPSYAITNLGATIRNTAKRLEQLQREKANPRAADRIITAKYGGPCEDCGAELERGQQIRYSRAAGARCIQCPGEEA